MKLSWGICTLFYGAVALALLVPIIKEKVWRPVGVSTLKESWVKSMGGLLLAGIFSVLAMLLQLDIAAAWPYLLGASGLYGLLSGLNLTAEARGVTLLTVGFALFSNFSDPSTVPLPLIASFLGLAFGKLFNPNAWEDFILPGTWLVGLYWLAPNISEGLLASHISLLTIFISVGLMTRTLQAFPMLAHVPVWLRPLYIGIIGGLSAWLAVQNMLLYPPFLPWVGLFAGGLVLGFLLLNPSESIESPANGAAIAVNRQEQSATPAAPQAGVIALLLLGMATLVASRLFGTAGWVVLAVGLLSNRRSGSYVSVAAMFLLARVLLQAFLTQFSANVTGINITHPYASAALFVGFAMMLILPNWLNALPATAPAVPHNDAEILNDPKRLSLILIPFVLLGLGSLLFAGLSNYFLHAEATASLLLALIVSGLGVSLLAQFYSPQARALPLFATLLTLAGALVSPEILDWGNEAEKGQKLVVLGVALVLVLLIAFLTQRLGSGRKPIQVS